MKDLAYGQGYQYAHDEPDAVAGMDCLPESLQDRSYYQPTERGFEKEIKRRLDGWEEIKKEDGEDQSRVRVLGPVAPGFRLRGRVLGAGCYFRLPAVSALRREGHARGSQWVAVSSSGTLRNISARSGRMNEKR